MKVVLIGSGNVGTILGRLIKSAGHAIVQVVGRQTMAVETLATELGALASIGTISLITDADIYIICVSDGGIIEISRELNLRDRIVVHTSGAVSKEALRGVTEYYGVLYPLQSLRKELPVLPAMPLLVDGNTRSIRDSIAAFAGTLSPYVAYADDDERLKLHIAAVVVSNFTNHLYVLAKDYCVKENIDFQLLIPLIQEVAFRISGNEPEKLQTGPAIRGDRATIEKHDRLLAHYPLLREIYRALTESILNYHNK